MGISWLIGDLVEDAPDWIEWFIDLSAAGIFWLLFQLFDNWLWRFPPVRFIGRVRVPNLTGEWKGVLKSRYDDHTTERDCHLTITQKWTSMCVLYHGQQSDSDSRAASIILDENGRKTLRYEYFNQPKDVERQVLDPHWGTTRLVLGNNLGTLTLSGTYYTDRSLQTAGSMELSRIV
jgi:hypothetical protein